jgi:membrane protease YdiL (CAAX protease family)
MESWRGGINGEPDRSIPSESESDNRVESSNRKPWGFWWTLLFAGIIAVVYVCVHLVVAIAFGAIAKHRARLEFNGLYLSVAVLSSTVVCGSLILLFVKFRRGTSVSQYLRLTPVPPAQLAKWSLAMLLYAAACDAANVLLGRPIVPAFMTESYRTAGVLPLFWLAIVVAAPLFEELFFRGFVFAGWVASRLGPYWTIGMTAVVWGGIHQQYEPLDIFFICTGGVILGLARLKTDSVYTPIMLHSLMNLVATIETSLFARTSP